MYKQFNSDAGPGLAGKWYVPIPVIRRRLDSIGPWSWEILDRRWDDRPMKSGAPKPTYHVVGRLTIPGLQSFRDGWGIQDNPPGSGKDWIKGADANALKQAAGMFGVPVGIRA